jgi:hypothetical protein
MYADTGPGAELILTNKTEKQLASRLLRNFVIGIACTIAGAGDGPGRPPIPIRHISST